MLRFGVLLVLVALVLVLCGCGPDVEAVEATRPSDPPPTFLAWPTTTSTLPPATTTTTVAPTTTSVAPPHRQTAPASGPATGVGQVNGYPCGGDLPPCWVLARESGGDPTAVNPTGCGGHTCGGLWQFDPRTWAGFGGYRHAQDAPAEVQNQAARQLWAGGSGCSHWAACR